jgi:hypothetical protein
VAFVLARQRRLAGHRRWMLRSFALTMSFTVTRFGSTNVGDK